MRSKKQLTDSQASEPGGLGLNITVTEPSPPPAKTAVAVKPKSAIKSSSKKPSTNVLGGEDEEEFQFDMPFNADLSSLSPLSFQQQQQQSKPTLQPSSSSIGLSYSSLLAAELKSIPSASSMHQSSSQRQLKFAAPPTSSASNTSANSAGT